MIYEQVVLSGALVTSSATTTIRNTNGMIDKWVSFRGISAGSVVIEISYNGVDFLAIGISITADEWTEVPEAATHIRLNPTGLTVTEVVLRYGLL